jgi:hypothetical protein
MAQSLSLVLALGLLSLGCGGTSAVKVEGKITKGGKEMTGEKGHYAILLIPVVDAGANYTTYPGRAEADGKFVIEKVPPGKYKVSVQWEDAPGMDKLGGKFSKDKTKIERTIDGKTPLEIDIDKDAG